MQNNDSSIKKKQEIVNSSKKFFATTAKGFTTDKRSKSQGKDSSAQKNNWIIHAIENM